jgi:hypothetical protein
MPKRHCARSGWVVNAMSRSHYSRETNVTHCAEDAWVSGPFWVGKTTEIISYCKIMREYTDWRQLFCTCTVSITLTEQSKPYVCRRSLAGTAASNPAWSTDICLLWVMCVVKYGSLLRSDHLSRRVVRSVRCQECDREASTMIRLWPSGGWRAKKNL